MFVRPHRGSKILAAREPGSRIFLREPTSSVKNGSVECFSFDPWGGPATEYTAIRTARWPPRVLISAGWIDAQEHIRLRMSKIPGAKEGNKGSSIIQPVDSTRGCDWNKSRVDPPVDASLDKRFIHRPMAKQVLFETVYRGIWWCYRNSIEETDVNDRMIP